VSFKARPTLKRVVMPGATRHVLIEVKVAVREYVEPSALLIADHHRQRVLKLLAKTHIHHARVEWPPPHAGVEPARSRKRSRSGARKNQIGSRGKHGFLRRALYIRSRAFLGLFADTGTAMPLAKTDSGRARISPPMSYEALCLAVHRDKSE